MWLFPYFSAERLRDFDIRVGNTFDGSTYDKKSFTLGARVAGSAGWGETRTIEFDKAVTGRYVAVNMDVVEYLTMCEFEVYA